LWMIGLVALSAQASCELLALELTRLVVADRQACQLRLQPSLPTKWLGACDLDAPFARLRNGDQVANDVCILELCRQPVAVISKGEIPIGEVIVIAHPGIANGDVLRDGPRIGTATRLLLSAELSCLSRF